MAAGAAKLSAEPSGLDNTIAVLKRCLALSAPCSSGTSCPPPPSSVVPPTSPTVDKPGDVEMVHEKSMLPGDQHMFTDDEARMGATERSNQIKIVEYQDETQIGEIMRLITKDLSEPYSIYTYRYFIHGWPDLCLLAMDSQTNTYVGAVVCKLDKGNDDRSRGYIAMLAVDESCRRLGIGTRLVRRAIENMQQKSCDEVVLETEVTNKDSMRLYSNLGFIREKRLFRYYLNGVDAFRLKLYFSPPSAALASSAHPSNYYST